MKKQETFFGVKDLVRIKKVLEKAEAKEIKVDGTFKLTLQEFKTLRKLSNWADGVLEEAQNLNLQCKKN